MAKTASQAESERLEEISAAVVASVTGGRFHRRDLGGLQMYDFDLCLGDATEAVEVCSFADPIVREQWQALAGADVVATQLRSTWTVSVARGARMKRLPQRVEPHLAVLEQHGLTSFDAGEHFRLIAAGVAAEIVAVSEALVRLGVRDAVRAPERPGEPARVVVASGTSGAGSRSLVNHAVQFVAFKRDNRLKLQTARKARRRHIVVPIDPSAGPVWSIVRQEPPPTPPRLPASVDVAWVIGANGRTLRSELPRAWEAVRVDARVWDDPDAWRV